MSRQKEDPGIMIAANPNRCASFFRALFSFPTANGTILYCFRKSNRLT